MHKILQSYVDFYKDKLVENERIMSMEERLQRSFRMVTGPCGVVTRYPPESLVCV